MSGLGSLIEASPFIPLLPPPPRLSVQPHLAADNLDKIHDENGNNLLHVAASKGHAECLQHLTSLMGEDCLNERNTEQLTPAGLAIKVTS